MSRDNHVSPSRLLSSRSSRELSRRPVCQSSRPSLSVHARDPSRPVELACLGFSLYFLRSRSAAKPDVGPSVKERRSDHSSLHPTLGDLEEVPVRLRACLGLATVEECWQDDGIKDTKAPALRIFPEGRAFQVKLTVCRNRPCLTTGGSAKCQKFSRRSGKRRNFPDPPIGRTAIELTLRKISLFS